jgi:predicted DNA-binding transcriptional regulator AlpA
MTGKAILRPNEIWRKLGCKKSKGYKDYAPRLRWIPLGGKSVGALESDVDALIDEIIAEGESGHVAVHRPDKAVETSKANRARKAAKNKKPIAGSEATTSPKRGRPRKIPAVTATT